MSEQPLPPELVYPELHAAASLASRHGRRGHTQLVMIDLALLALAAIIGLIRPQLPDLPETWAGILAPAAGRIVLDGQDVTARFAELQVPVVSPEMDVPLVHSLSLQGSIRHDTYNDFGDTTNSAYGFTYEPIEWINIFANLSESFVAPTPIARSSSRRSSIDGKSRRTTTTRSRG